MADPRSNPSERRAPEWLVRTTYTHRGLHGPTVPENSLEGAQGAIKAGFGIECDVQRSGEGTAFVFHDFELDRLTQTRGIFDHCHDEDLAKLSLLGTGQSPVPLTRFLSVIAGREPLLIEIKSKPDYDPVPTCQSVAAALREYSGTCAVMSFDPRVAIWFHAHYPHNPIGLVGTDSLPNGFETVWRDPDILARANPDFLAVDCRDLACASAVDWRASGKPLLSWTIRTRADHDAARPLADALIAEAEGLS